MHGRQAHQSREIKITADDGHVFMGAVNFGHQGLAWVLDAVFRRGISKSRL